MKLYYFAPAVGTDEMGLPVGTFVFATTNEAGTFNPDYTSLMDVFPHPEDPEGGLVAYSYTPVDGTVEISRDESGAYVIGVEYTGVLLDENGNELDRALCKASYEGEVPFVDIFAYTPLEGDVELNIPNLSGRYVDGDYTLTFYSVELDEDGWLIGGGDLFNTELFTENVAPMNTDDLEGTYTPVDVFGEGMIPGRFMQGVWYDMFGGMYAAIGTALTVYDENVNPTNVGLAMDGTITVTKVGNEHLFVFDLVTAEGNKMTGSWQGVVADYVADFSEPSGIGSVNSGQSVRGGKGCVIAPEGSEVCSVAGVRMTTDGLAPGVYVVRSTSGVSKVVVR